MIKRLLTHKKYNSFDFPIEVLSELYMEALLVSEQLDYELSVVTTAYMKDHIKDDISTLVFNTDVLHNQIKTLTLAPFQMN